MRPRRATWVRQPNAPDTRHRGGVPWDLAQIPPRWHACRPQTIELHRDGGLLTGTYRCACGAVTDCTGAWRHRNIRRRSDPAGLRYDPGTPQPVRAGAAAPPPRSGLCCHPRSQPAGTA